MATLYLPSSGGYSAGTYVKYRIEVIEGAISGRTRSITVNVKYWRTNTGYTTYGSGTCYCTIGGTTYSQTISSSQTVTYNSYTTLFSKTLNVSYDNYGAKSLAITAYSSTNVANLNSSAQGGTLALSNIGAVTYTVAYNANGGTGAPGSQVKTYGTALTLSSITPTRAGYNFLGWSASSTATSATYAAGGSYTSNASTTLYAVWSVAYVKPRINNLTIYRCTSSGGISDTGTYFTADFDWATDKTVSSVIVKWKATGATSWSSSTMSASGKSGSVSSVLGSNAISAESTYTVMVTVTDASGISSKTATVSGKVYPIDFLSGGNGVAFGKPAETPDILDSDWPIYEQGEPLSAKYAPTCDTSGIWTYTKWPNGRVELYGVHDISNIACATALGSWYRTDVFTPSAFPFKIENPRLIASYESDGYGAVLWATTTTTASKPPSYYLIRPTSATIASGKVIFHVTGICTDEVIPSYTNVLDTVGYTNGYRLNSSGKAAARTDRSITGFIDVSVGDVLYFKNIETLSSDYGCSVACYTSNDESGFITGKSYVIATTSPNATWHDDGSLATFKIAEEGTEYVRFCFVGIDETSIITINEPIE